MFIKNCFLKYWSVSILFDLLSCKKSSATPYKIRKKILLKLRVRVSKETEFCADFKNVQKSRVWQKGKKLLQKNWVFRDLENLAKKRKILSLCKSSTHFWNQRKIALLLIPFAPNFKEFFKNSLKGWCYFLEVKRSNKITTF